MLTSDERRAVLFLAAVAAAGALVRVVRAPGVPPGASVVAPELGADDLARQAALARREAQLLRPLEPGERIDVDRASARELERLPRVGPALARRIVDDRTARGPFGSLASLDEVAGIGPSLLALLEPHVSFSGPPRPVVEVVTRKRVGARPRGSAALPTPGRRAP